MEEKKVYLDNFIKEYEPRISSNSEDIFLILGSQGHEALILVKLTPSFDLQKLSLSLPIGIFVTGFFVCAAEITEEGWKKIAELEKNLIKSQDIRSLFVILRSHDIASETFSYKALTKEKQALNIEFKDIKSKLAKEKIMICTRMPIGDGTAEKPKTSYFLQIKECGDLFFDLDQKQIPNYTQLQKYVQKLKPLSSGISELEVEFLFPMTAPSAPISLSLRSGASWPHFDQCPIYLLWNKETGTLIEEFEKIFAKHRKVEEYVLNMVQKNSLKKLKILSFSTNSFSIFPLSFPFVYEKKFGDDELLPQRKEYHEAFQIESQPLLRCYLSREQSQILHSRFVSKIPYIHTHCLSKRQLGEDSLRETVKGLYYYFHYLQDGESDNGWGCAYRSLQTLISWFVCQGYGNIPIPSIREIQQALVDQKDKPAKFVGSTDWIGAYEVMLCLMHFLKVESKINNLSSGSAIVTNAHSLLKHFRTMGTPIMIGGGAYAYTILGVEVNDLTGDVMLLILDPHYTGSDDMLSNILSKGWCKWLKPSERFHAKEFYNLCMPSLPRIKMNMNYNDSSIKEIKGCLSERSSLVSERGAPWRIKNCHHNN